MTATLKKIDPIRKARFSNNEYIRLHFQADTGEYLMTDLCPTFRNYSHWREIISAGVGTTIEGFKLMGRQKIDADSEPKIISKTLFSKQLELVS